MTIDNTEIKTEQDQWTDSNPYCTKNPFTDGDLRNIYTSQNLFPNTWKYLMNNKQPRADQ